MMVSLTMKRHSNSMHIPFFFEEKIPSEDKFILSEDTSKHVLQVLRMRKNDQLYLTNGYGEVLKAFITLIDKKKVQVQITERNFIPKSSCKISLGISLIKNVARFEWFLEKATEIGVNEIIPFISERTEKQHFRFERMKNILVSAMLQSQQAWLPEIHEPLKLKELIRNSSQQEKFIAHCFQDKKIKLKSAFTSKTDLYR